VTASATTLTPSSATDLGEDHLPSRPASITALMAVQTLRSTVIRPTLTFLGVNLLAAENLVLGTLLATSRLPLECRLANAIGPFAIPTELHTELWDGYLAQQPDQASLIRGLASQHCFLQNPHAELGYNLAYATAIAWLIYQRQGVCLHPQATLAELSRIWQTAYPHRGGRAVDFMDAWASASASELLFTA